MDLAIIAQRSILPATNTDALLKKDYGTRDIMQAVFACYNKHWKDVKDFAPALKGESLYETCSNIWHFVKANISYVKDPAENQWVRSPKRLWHDKQGDCKSYSVFIASCLRALRIPHIFRFVAFEQYDSNPTHVYVVVMKGRKEIILDCVIDAFDKEAPYTFKFDYMKGLYEMNGLPGVHGGVATILNGGKRKEAIYAALPQIAMNFIYLYIPHGSKPWNPTETANYRNNVPAIIWTKEEKAAQTSWDWGAWAGITVEKDLYPKIREVLTQQLGIDPTAWWKNVLRGTFGISGDEAANTNTNSNTTTTDYSWVKSILSLFGGNNTLPFKHPLESFTPEVSDWGNMQLQLNPVTLINQKVQMATQVPVTSSNSGGTTVFQPTTQTPNYSNTSTMFDTATGLFRDAAGNYYNSNGAIVDPATGMPLNSSNSLNASTGSSNMLLTIGLLGAAAFLLLRKK